jgi:hypothetical protein
MSATRRQRSGPQPRGSLRRAWSWRFLAALPPIGLLALIGLASESNEGPDKCTEVFLGAWLLLVAFSTYRAARRRERPRFAAILIGISPVLAAYVLAILALVLSQLLTR